MKQDLPYDMEEVFELVIENQKQNQTKVQELSEKQKQALRDSSQTTTQTIKRMSEEQIRAYKESNNALKKINKIYQRRNRKTL